MAEDMHDIELEMEAGGADIPPGVYRAALVTVVDLGLQSAMRPGKGKDDAAESEYRAIYFGFEVLLKDKSRARIGRQYSRKLTPKTHLRAVVEALHGGLKPGDKVTLAGLLGKSAQVKVIEKTKPDGTVVTDIETVMELGDGQAPLQPESALAFFNADHPDWDALDDLPDFLRDKAEDGVERLEAAAKTKAAAKAKAEIAAPADDVTDDDPV